jgi:hypothetical protein
VAELKTKKTTVDVDGFVAAVEPERRRTDAHRVLAIMRDVTGEPGAMWGASMIGFGTTGSWFKVGFSPRKANLVVYLIDGFEARTDLLTQLGPHKIGASCLYVTALDRIDESVLRRLVHASFTS